MKPTLLFSALITAALAIQPAKADTFTVSFNGGSLGYSGSGNFVGTLTTPGVYQITGVLPGGSVTDPGFGTSSIVALSTYTGADNLLFYPHNGNYFDANGLAFTLANGSNIALFNYTSGSTLFLSALESRPGGDIPEFVTETVTSSAPTPEPASFVLLGTSALAGVGLLRRRLLA